jgi:hypothetical protein
MTEPYGVRQRLAPTPRRMIVSCQRAAFCDHIRLSCLQETLLARTLASA